MRHHLISLGIYLALALATTWPVVQHATSRLPIGTEISKTVPLFNAWTIWWNADRLLHTGRGYWDAPIFYPTGDSFAFSEPQPTTVLVAPILWMSDSRVLAYNAYLWLSLMLNGFFAERLLRLVGMGKAIALGGGAAMVLLPIVHWQLGVLQLVPLWGILWTWTAFLKIARPADWWGRRQALRHGGELGAAFAMAFLTCVHHGLFLAVLMVGAAWTLGPRLLQLRTWGALLTAVGVAAVLTGPVVAKLHQVAKEHQFERPVETVARLSAMPVDYMVPSGNAWIDWGTALGRPGWQLSPGLLMMVLAVIGVLFGIAQHRLRIWTLFLAVTAVLGFLLSLGTNLRVGCWQPWLTLAEVGPGLSQVRNVFRFAYFVQMATVLCGAQGVHALVLLVDRCGISKAWRCLGVILVTSVALLAVADPWPRAPRLGVAPEVTPHQEWIEIIRDQTPPGHGIVCLPFARGNHVVDFEVATRWMFLGTYHHAAMVNGYSGFFPDHYFQIRRAIDTQGLSENVLRQLADDGVEFLVVDRSLFPARAVHRRDRGEVVLERVWSGAAGIDLYRLVRLRPS